MREHHRSAVLMSVVVIALLGAVSVVPIQTASAEVSGDYEYSLINNGIEVEITGYTGTGGSITIPGTIAGLPVTAIGFDAFENIDSLTTVTIPNSVISIGGSAFAYCGSLTSVDLGSGVTSIGDSAFSYCSLTSITIPDSVTSIGNDAFAYSFLTSVTIPNSVTSIGASAFYDCSSLTSVTIGSGVTAIGGYAFGICSALTTITVDPNNPSYASVDGVLFDKETTSMVTYPGGKTGSYSIPDGVTIIGNDTFANCFLTSVTIPNSVTTIGGYAFFSCPALSSITIPDSVTTIGDSAFSGCSALSSITIPDSVTTIGSYAFFHSSLTTAIVQGGATTIGNSAFAYCGNLTSVNLGSGVTVIGGTAFAYCGNLTSVTIPNSVTNIGDEAFMSCRSLTTVIIEDSVTTIGNYTFGWCTALTSVDLGSGVTVIGDNAFYCASFTSITIPDSVTSIGSCAFQVCSYLTSVDIGSGVTSIGGGAFSYCSLTSITIPDSVTSIGVYAFGWCPSLTSVDIGSGVTTIDGRAFADCSALKNITIPKTVSYIGESAFSQCFNLTDIYFEGDAPSVGVNWAENCTKLTIHYNDNATGFTSPVWNGVAAYPISGSTSILAKMTPALEAAVFGAGAALAVAVVFSAPVEVSPVTGTKAAVKRKHRLLDFITGAIKADAQGLAGNVLDDLGLEKKNATEREPVIFGFSWPELFTALLASFVLGFSFMFTKGIDLGSAVNWLTYVLVAGVAAVSSGLTQHRTAKRLGAIVEYKLWYLGSIVLLLTTLLFGVAFSSPSKVAINDKEKMTVRQQAVVSMSGPLTSFAVFLIFLVLVPFGGTLASIGLLGASTNLLMAAYSMMPFIPMAGNKVYKWNKLAWAGMFVPMVVLYFAMSYLL